MNQLSNFFFNKNVKICRICMRNSELDENSVFTDIFESVVEGFELKDLILQCLGVEVNKNDNRPKLLCTICLNVVTKWIKTKVTADKSQHVYNFIVTNKLSQYQTEYLLESSNELFDPCDNNELPPVLNALTFKQPNPNETLHSEKHKSPVLDVPKSVLSNGENLKKVNSQLFDGKILRKSSRQYAKNVKQNVQAETHEFGQSNPNESHNGYFAKLNDSRVHMCIGCDYDKKSGSKLETLNKEKNNKKKMSEVQPSKLPHCTRSRSKNGKYTKKVTQNNLVSTEEYVDLQNDQAVSQDNSIDHHAQELPLCDNNEESGAKLEPLSKVKNNKRKMSKVQPSKLPHCTRKRTKKRKYTKKVTQNNLVSTEEYMDLQNYQVVSQDNSIDRHPQESHLYDYNEKSGVAQFYHLDEVKIEVNDEMHCAVTPYTNGRTVEEEKNTSQLTLVNRNATKRGVEAAIDFDYLNEVKIEVKDEMHCVFTPYTDGRIVEEEKNTPQLTLINEVKIEENDEMHCDTSMNFGLDVMETESSNSEHLDVVIPNTDGIETNKEINSPQLKIDSGVAIDGCVEATIGLNNSQNRVNQIGLKMTSVFVRCNDNKSDETTYYEHNVSHISEVHKSKLSVADTAKTRTNKRKCTQRLITSEIPTDDMLDGIFDANENRYCLCDEVASDTMIACDNKKCVTEWFHYICVGLKKTPRGKWYCPKCINLPIFKKKPKSHVQFNK